ncbi:superoxide reductase [Orenia metallireducens]|jgi:superoxide reductase|uniref:Superoxide reductase n=1 Tax=Orenia metallireducens TaxID=1413210 RepID=A0A285H2Y4_9FIRM|nr:class II SORL domain-containing protein [Orenia metallireducens]PRX29480.1 superoxide reductase [Orenia metallireducens]SNY30132.1 superoxide reductase [Orenia metallireducens]
MQYYEVKQADDPNNKTELEKKHIPVIQAPDKVKKDEYFDITIKMGEIDHPVEPGHFIQYVDLYANYYHLGRANFTPEMKPEVTFKVKLKESCTIRGYELCNLHGQWQGNKEITVE